MEPLHKDSHQQDRDGLKEGSQDHNQPVHVTGTQLVVQGVNEITTDQVPGDNGIQAP